MSRLSPGTRWALLPLMGAVMIAGCSKTEQAERDSAAAAQAETTTARADTTKRGGALALDAGGIARLATRYTFPRKNKPKKSKKSVVTALNHGVLKADAPDLEISAATSTSPPTDPEILALVTSNKSYSGLGIGPDSNYIVRDKNGSSKPEDWRVYVVSTKPFGMLRLWRGSEPLNDDDPKEARIVYSEFPSSGSVHPLDDMIAFAFCFEDSACKPVNHCGYNNGQ